MFINCLVCVPVTFILTIQSQIIHGPALEGVSGRGECESTIIQNSVQRLMFHRIPEWCVGVRGRREVSPVTDIYTDFETIGYS